MNATNAWKKALQQLQIEMPKAAFDTWVRDVELVAFEDGVFSLGVKNAYARDWLIERITDKLTQILTANMGQPMEVQFAVLDHLKKTVKAPDEDGSQSSEPEITISAKEYETVYEQIVHPHRQIVVPGYFRRHLRAIGPKMAWMYLAFRQLAYQQGGRTNTKTDMFSGRQIAALCGISERTFWYRVKKEKTWESLAGLVAHIETEPEWREEEELRRLPLNYEVSMTLPLTAADARSLSHWLGKNIEQFDGPEGVLNAACITSLDELIPLDAESENWNEPITVRQIVFDLFRNTLSDNKLDSLASALQNHIMPPTQDTIHVTLYFMENVLPFMSAGEAWLLTLLRDRCYVNPDTGEVRNTVKVTGGYKEIADWLGLKRSKTIWKWLRDQSPLSMFLHDREGERRGERIFDVLLEDLPHELIAIALDDDRWEPFQSAMQNIIDGEEPGNSMARLAVSQWRVSQNSIAGLADSNGATCSIAMARFADHDGATCSIGMARLADRDGATCSITMARFAHSNGATCRVFKSLNLLNQPNNLLNTSTTTTVQNAPLTESGKKPVAVAGQWNFNSLFSTNIINTKTKKQLLKTNASPNAFVSYLLYGASPEGEGLVSPLAYTLSELKANPHAGAGGAYDHLASLTPQKLWGLINDAYNNHGFANNDTWKQVFTGASQVRLNILADQLFGKPLTDKNTIIVRETRE